MGTIGLTVGGELLDNLHDAGDAGLLAVGVVEKGFVTNIHAAHMVSGCGELALYIQAEGLSSRANLRTRECLVGLVSA